MTARPARSHRGMMSVALGGRASGRASYLIGSEGDVLESHGFADLVNVVGGTSAWIAAGHEVEKGGADECADVPPSSSRP